MPDVAWLGLEGGPIDWGDPELDGFCVLLRESAEAPAHATNGNRVALVFNRSPAAISIRLPAPAEGRVWWRVRTPPGRRRPRSPAETFCNGYRRSR